MRGYEAARAAIAGSPDVYLRLVDECGWPPARYEETLRDALMGALAP